MLFLLLTDFLLFLFNGLLNSESTTLLSECVVASSYE